MFHLCRVIKIESEYLTLVRWPYFDLNFWHQSETWNLVGVIVVLIFVGYLLQKWNLKYIVV